MTGEKRSIVQPKKLVTFMVLAGLISALSACDGGDGIAALDREPTSADQLPAYVNTDNLDVDSVRKAVDIEGLTYFLARGDEGGYCVIRTGDQGENEYLVSCVAGSGNLTSVSLGSMASEPRAMTLVTDSYATDVLEEEGWTKIQQNILVR